MNRLIINTANDQLFLVLQVQDQVFSLESQGKAKHNETLIPMIDQLLITGNLKIKDIDEFGVVVGPGSFTGIRVGISTIKAFCDALKKPCKGINNLDYLFALSKNANLDFNVVAMLGSKDSYFVARYIHEKLYKYERNLTTKELEEVSNGSVVAVFKKDENLNSIELKNDAGVLLKCCVDSSESVLVPVYYQLSQAEREKNDKMSLEIFRADLSHADIISEIEKSSILTNSFDKSQIEDILKSKDYITFLAQKGPEIAGFVSLQITDEANIVSLAVKKEFRNMGIASKLVEIAEKETKNLGLDTISLEVNYSNITAYLLYEKLGFEIRRTRKNYYADGNDCLEMCKQLNQV